jgi:hypothetical protein
MRGGICGAVARAIVGAADTIAGYDGDEIARLLVGTDVVGIMGAMFLSKATGMSGIFVETNGSLVKPDNVENPSDGLTAGAMEHGGL